MKTSFWKSYGAHLLGYITAAVGTVVALTPSALTAFPSLAPLAPYVGPTGLVAILAGAAGIAVHNTQTATNNADVAKQPTSTMPSLAWLAPLLLVATLPFLHGCTTLTADMSTPVGQATTAAIAQVAVTTAETKGVTAAELQKLASAGLAADASATTTLLSVEGALNAAFTKMGLPSGDAAALQILEVALDGAAAASVGSNKTYQNAQVEISDLLTAVLVAAGGTPPVPAPTAPTPAPAAAAPSK
jgi:hypothetical protein